MTTKKVYPEGLLGRKVGMTQVFNEAGSCIPVTVLEVGPCSILDLITDNKSGYQAIKVGFLPRDKKNITKPEMGVFDKAGKGVFSYVKEIRCDYENLGWNEIGKEISVADVFAEKDFVDIRGVSKGKGFTGVVKRFNAKGQPASRGTHEYFRHIGSIGNCKSPGRVFKNRKMPGQHGNKNVNVQNLKVIGVKPESNLLLVKGCVPGANGNFVVIKKSIKKYFKNKAA